MTDLLHMLDGVTRGMMLVSGIGWAVITFLTLRRARVSGVSGLSGETALPIIMAAGGVLWALADAMAWGDMQALGVHVSTLSIAVRVAAGVAVSGATLRLAYLSGRIERELIAQRIVDAAYTSQDKRP